MARSDVAQTSVVCWTDPRDESLCFVKMPVRAKGWRRMLLMAAAGAALVLGLLGIVLPGLPTTPFVLVASYCLLRSSPRLHARLLREPVVRRRAPRLASASRHSTVTCAIRRRR